ncbi:AAA family ATPase [Chitinispirillales bacterium ANBcel5]|uniref:AAA family ATPase n=1 Tax=Cellulosispirillum alkaliphilum TaxID=3039283 RepID=UPI002A53EE41|nr:AAA family ATPase [Chitinispirillales bacterium ANBcel5]
MNIILPYPNVIVMIGPSGSGKSLFATKHFLPTEIVSSDKCRGMISDDENDQSVSSDAFDLVHLIVQRRLKYEKLTVIDATNVKKTSRESILRINEQCGAFNTTAFIFNLPLSQCIQNDKNRERSVGADVIKKQFQSMNESIDSIKNESYLAICVFHDISSVLKTKITVLR